MKLRYYRLDAKGRVEVCTMMEAAAFLATKESFVKQEQVGRSRVSTIFLPLCFRNPPLFWETMVFGGKLDQHQERCSGTKEQAEAMHQKIVAMVISTNEKQN